MPTVRCDNCGHSVEIEDFKFHDLRHCFCTKLAQRGVDIYKIADNGGDAINIIKTEDFDLVLSDLGMPDVNGYEVPRARNKLEKRPKIGIITDWRDSLEGFNEEDTKVDFILKKPFKHSVLEKHINELFGADCK